MLKKSLKLFFLCSLPILFYVLFILMMPVEKVSAVTLASSKAYKTTGATVVTQADCNEVTLSPDTGYNYFISGAINNEGTANVLLVKFSGTSNNTWRIPPGQVMTWDSEFIATSIITYCAGASTTTYFIGAVQTATQ